MQTNKKRNLTTSEFFIILIRFSGSTTGSGSSRQGLSGGRIRKLLGTGHVRWRHWQVCLFVDCHCMPHDVAGQLGVLVV